VTGTRDLSHAGEEFGGPAKRRSGWLIPLAVFFVTACLSALVLAYYFAPTPPGLAQEQPAPTDANRPVQLALGSMHLRIPANYILLVSARRGGAMNELALIAMLPDFQGYTLGAAQDLTANAPDSRVISIMLKGDQALLPEQERLERVYMTQVENPNGQPGPYGLRQYAFRADSGYHDQDLFVGSGPQGLMVLLCTKLASDIPSSNCLRDMPLDGGIALSYRFKRAHLSQWRTIDTRIHALMDSFVEKT
jgi:hypothetical protein